MAIKVVVVGGPSISRIVTLLNTCDIVTDVLSIGFGGGGGTLLGSVNKDVVFAAPLNTWFDARVDSLAWNSVAPFKHVYRETTTLHGIRYKLAKRNCKGRMRTGRVFNSGILFKLRYLRRNDPMRSFNFIKWDKVNCLPNHFLGGRRR